MNYGKITAYVYVLVTCHDRWNRHHSENKEKPRGWAAPGFSVSHL